MKISKSKETVIPISRDFKIAMIKQELKKLHDLIEKEKIEHSLNGGPTIINTLSFLVEQYEETLKSL